MNKIKTLVLLIGVMVLSGCEKTLQTVIHYDNEGNPSDWIPANMNDLARLCRYFYNAGKEGRLY